MKNKGFVVITGASTGIGYATSKTLLNQGYTIFGSVRKEADAVRLQNELGNKFNPLIFDVTDNAAIDDAAKKVKESVGNQGLTALINNAGIVVSGPLQHIEIKEFKKQFDVNVFGVLKVTQAFLPMLGAVENATHSPGKIINMSSVSGFMTMPFIGPYCASKFALESMSDAMRRELLLFGIDVVVLQPGPIKTPIWGKANTDEPQYQDTAYAKIFSQMMRFVKSTEKRALPVETVSNRILQIIENKNSSARYIIHKTKWRTWMASKMPDRFIDYFIKRGLKKVMDG